jgi:hypothetical protein
MASEDKEHTKLKDDGQRKKLKFCFRAALSA